jgi:hypothetical protein
MKLPLNVSGRAELSPLNVLLSWIVSQLDVPRIPLGLNGAAWCEIRIVLASLWTGSRVPQIRVSQLVILAL